MIPEHYSRDIAQRCQSLIRSLLPAVQGGLADDGRFGGPLSTTFLLAMATPMVVLPIERIVKPAHPGAAQVGDDRQLDPALVQEVDNVLGHARTFGAAPFVVPGRWSYVSEYPPFNIAHQWPPELLESLGRPDAYENAERAPAGRILRDLRNALAHGGVAYLDAQGCHSGGRATMLAFAAARKSRNGQLIGLNTLRIGEADFCAFLMAWADWLAQPRLRAMLDRLDPLAA